MNWSIFIILQDMASKHNNKTKQNCCFSWPLSPLRTPALHRGFGARGTFRPLRSGTDQAHHLPEATVPQPRKAR